MWTFGLRGLSCSLVSDTTGSFKGHIQHKNLLLLMPAQRPSLAVELQYPLGTNLA